MVQRPWVRLLGGRPHQDGGACARILCTFSVRDIYRMAVPEVPAHAVRLVAFSDCRPAEMLYRDAWTWPPTPIARPFRTRLKVKWSSSSRRHR